MVVARFARTMGTLIRSGITVVQALEVVEEVVGNKVVANAIRQARVSITEGILLLYLCKGPEYLNP